MNFRRSDQKSVDAFLLQITGIVEENMSDEHFGAEALARKAGLSRSAIHRRLMILTRKSATRFIREIRLDKAMEMMQHTNDTAAEIAYKTGFGSPAYFHHCFHQYFGCTPLEARKLSSSAFRDPLLLQASLQKYGCPLLLVILQYTVLCYPEQDDPGNQPYCFHLCFDLYFVHICTLIWPG